MSTTGFERAEELLRDADEAMYRAKRRGKGGHEVCNTEQHEQAVRRLALEAELRKAVREGKLTLLYQPIVELESGRVAGFEALLRWPHPTRGLLRPSEFLHLALEGDILKPLSDWVLAGVCAQLREWRSNPATRDVKVSLNVSERQLAFHDFFDQLAALLTAGSIDGTRLLLDVSATSLARTGHHLESHRELLAHFGIAISVDDFGTGMVPLELLEGLPIDSFKVDQRLIAALEAGEGHDRVRRLVKIAAAFGRPAIAEGVENARMRPMLRELGFMFAQGFCLQVPVDSEEARGMVAKVL